MIHLTWKWDFLTEMPKLYSKQNFGLLIPNGVFFFVCVCGGVMSPFLSVKTKNTCLRKVMNDSKCDPCFLYLVAYASCKEKLVWLKNVQQVPFPFLSAGFDWIYFICLVFLIKIMSDKMPSGDMRWDEMNADPSETATNNSFSFKRLVVCH